jgi:hypothetical protein
VRGFVRLITKGDRKMTKTEYMNTLIDLIKQVTIHFNRKQALEILFETIKAATIITQVAATTKD